MYKTYKLVLHLANGGFLSFDFSAKANRVAEVAEHLKRSFEQSILCTSKITSYYYGEIEKFED